MILVVYYSSTQTQLWKLKYNVKFEEGYQETRPYNRQSLPCCFLFFRTPEKCVPSPVRQIGASGKFWNLNTGHQVALPKRHSEPRARAPRSCGGSAAVAHASAATPTRPSQRRRTRAHLVQTSPSTGRPADSDKHSCPASASLWNTPSARPPDFSKRLETTSSQSSSLTLQTWFRSWSTNSRTNPLSKISHKFLGISIIIKKSCSQLKYFCSHCNQGRSSCLFHTVRDSKSSFLSE